MTSKTIHFVYDENKLRSKDIYVLNITGIKKEERKTSIHIIFFFCVILVCVFGNIRFTPLSFIFRYYNNSNGRNKGLN